MSYPTYEDLIDCTSLWDLPVEKGKKYAKLVAQKIEKRIWCNPCKKDSDWNDIIKKEMIDMWRVCRDTCDVVMNCHNISEIVSINGIPYTGVQWENWKVLAPHWRRLRIYDLPKYCASVKLWCFDIEYKGWYDVFPLDLEEQMRNMIEWECAKDNWMPVQSYKAWDKSVTFCKSSDLQEWDAYYSSFKSVIDCYKRPFSHIRASC